MSPVTIQISGDKPEKYKLMLSDVEISKLLETLKRDFNLKTSKETQSAEEYARLKAVRRLELADDLESLRRSLEEVKLIKEGKLRAIPIEELLNEMHENPDN